MISKRSSLRLFAALPASICGNPHPLKSSTIESRRNANMRWPPKQPHLDGRLSKLSLSTKILAFPDPIPYDLGDVEATEIAEDPIVLTMPRNHPLAHHKVVSPDEVAREQLLLIEDGHCLRSYSLQACRIADPVRNEVFQATSLRTLVQMVAAELGITLMPQIAVDSELASNRNVVIRPLSPDKPFRTLVLAWRPTTSRCAEFRMLGNLIRECLTGTKRAFAPDHDIAALAAGRAARQAGIPGAIGCSDQCLRNFPLAIASRGPNVPWARK